MQTPGPSRSVQCRRASRQGNIVIELVAAVLLIAVVAGAARWYLHGQKQKRAYEDMQTALSSAASPSDKMSLLEGFLAEFPDGRFATQARAELDQAAAACGSDVMISLKGSLKDKSELPLAGRLLLLKTEMSAEQALEAAKARVGAASGGSPLALFDAISQVLAEKKPQVIASADVGEKAVLLRRIPAGTYLVYGATYSAARSIAVGVFDSVIVQQGAPAELTPRFYAGFTRRAKPAVETWMKAR